MLLGQHRPDQTNYCLPVGEDPDGVGASADLMVQPLGRVVRPDLRPHRLRGGSKRQKIIKGFLQVVGHVWEPCGAKVDDFAGLGPDAVSVRLLEDRVEHCRQGRPLGLRRHARQILGLVCPAPLPGRLWQAVAHGCLDSQVSVTGDDEHPS